MVWPPLALAVAGLAPVKRNRFIALDGAVKSVNRELEAKARDLAGLKGYVTNLAACPDGTPVTPEFVTGPGFRYIRTVKTGSRATPVQIIRSSDNKRGLRQGRPCRAVA